MNIKNWQPNCSIDVAIARASMLRLIREFFYNKKVLEVETPLLCKGTITDPYINPITVHLSLDKKDTRYLQTSPEFMMKRMLAANYGSIYQICKAFRSDEKGRLHNLEFSMLEWYRVGFDDVKLMQEVDELLQLILEINPAKYISYRDLFLKHLKVNPNDANLKDIKKIAINHFSKLNLSKNIIESYNKSDWLNLLFDTIIQPELKGNHAWIVFDYPEFMSALAKKSNNIYGELVAKRFEVFVNGIELGNAYNELQDANEQISRFTNDNELRKNIDVDQMPIDNELINALKHGIPECAGIAIGLDRVLMLKLKAESIHDVISFT